MENLSMPRAAGLAARVERERSAYDAGVDRERYQDLLASHAGYQNSLARARIARAALAATPLRRVLELGEYAWVDWLEKTGLAPGEVVCINISQRELDAGIAKSLGTRLKPDFRLMDAHELEFPDGHFDAVIGWGILHHLDLDRALGEVARVLAPGGVMVFSEPLDMNPVARLVRRLTPEARTPDEVPFRAAELAAVRRGSTSRSPTSSCCRCRAAWSRGCCCGTRTTRSPGPPSGSMTRSSGWCRPRAPGTARRPSSGGRGPFEGAGPPPLPRGRRGPRPTGGAHRYAAGLAVRADH